MSFWRERGEIGRESPLGHSAPAGNRLPCPLIEVRCHPLAHAGAGAQETRLDGTTSASRGLRDFLVGVCFHVEEKEHCAQLFGKLLDAGADHGNTQLVSGSSVVRP